MAHLLMSQSVYAEPVPMARLLTPQSVTSVKQQNMTQQTLSSTRGTSAQLLLPRTLPQLLQTDGGRKRGGTQRKSSELS